MSRDRISKLDRDPLAEPSFEAGSLCLAEISRSSTTKFGFVVFVDALKVELK